MSSEWEAGTRPWARRAGATIKCPFCGGATAILSFGDDRNDHARVELYCDSIACEAREIVVLVVRDGTNGTANRADVRALQELDKPAESRGEQFQARPFGEIADDARLSKESVTSRRRSPGPVTLELVGTN